MQPVPCGVAGELFIGGAGLARGYIGDAAQTKDRFIPNPFAALLKHNPAQKAVFGDKIYRTGDLVRWLNDGSIEYIGRTDFQVKLRGLRIELGEIETVIAQCAGVRQAVVLVVDGAADSKILVAYVVPGSCDEPAMREHLASKLPAYMMPQVFVFMDEFPRNPSGKVERKLLPKPNMVNMSGIVPPSTYDERLLLQIWYPSLPSSFSNIINR
jgi:acyl-coenzyme A synthetase/AMP-(fatty) acid ligase